MGAVYARLLLALASVRVKRMFWMSQRNETIQLLHMQIDV